MKLVQEVELTKTSKTSLCIQKPEGMSGYFLRCVFFLKLTTILLFKDRNHAVKVNLLTWLSKYHFQHEEKQNMKLQGMKTILYDYHEMKH